MERRGVGGSGSLNGDTVEKAKKSVWGDKQMAV